jgi:predicted dehydrogenase
MAEHEQQLAAAARGERLRVALLGAGSWAQKAHLPGFTLDPRCEVVVICDVEREKAAVLAAEFGVPEVSDDWQATISRDDIDIVDICTPSATHEELSFAALEAGKHVLCEKPVAYDYRQTQRAAAIARAKGLKTKLGFTFRYAPAMQYMRQLIADGFIGTPYIYNGYEQNSQWINPQTPLRQADPNADQSVLQVQSLEGYGAPIIDLGHWFIDADLTSVVGTLKNFVPERVVRQTGRMQRMNIDDGDIFIGEFANGAICSVQTSFVTVGNYPGLEARVYGSEGALICRLIEEFGICQTLRAARPDSVEFVDIEIPRAYFPPGGRSTDPWPELFYRNLCRDFIDEILEGGERNQGNFDDGAWVQEVINAVERSHRERAWVDLPLDGGATS